MPSKVGQTTSRGWGFVELFTLAGLAAAIGFPLLLRLRWNYTGGDLWPGLAGNFTASFAAFLIALGWDRRQRANERQEDLEAQLEAAKEHAADEQERRKTEARRRLEPVLSNLEQNDEAIGAALEEIKNSQSAPLILLFGGGWSASHDRLAQLLADPQLVADLGDFYGRADEVLWLSRHAQAPALGSSDAEWRSRALKERLTRMQRELPALISLVGAQAQEPFVHERGVIRRVVIADTGADVRG